MLDEAAARATTHLAEVGEFAQFAGKAARQAFLPPYEIRETVRQIYELGVRSAPLIAV
jgi:phospholipid/cholesterol/gamma-HCH transport system permease protein